MNLNTISVPRYARPTKAVNQRFPVPKEFLHVQGDSADIGLTLPMYVDVEEGE
jgi:hypothetical protein